MALAEQYAPIQMVTGGSFATRKRKIAALKTQEAFTCTLLTGLLKQAQVTQ